MKVAVDIQRVERARIRNALLKRDLALAAGLHPNTVALLYSEGRGGLVTIRKIAAALGLNAKTIIHQDPVNSAA